MQQNRFQNEPINLDQKNIQETNNGDTIPRISRKQMILNGEAETKSIT